MLLLIDCRRIACKKDRYQFLFFALNNLDYYLNRFFCFSVLGTAGAFFVCAVVIVKYAEGSHTVSKEFIE